MTFPQRIRLLPVLLLFVTTLSACDDSSTSAMDNAVPIVAERVTDLPSDPIIGLVDGRPVGAGLYTFYSLRENRVVAREDSASTQWDVAFRGTTILVNGGTSGPGQGAGLLLDGIFSEITEAPASGFETDSENGPALKTGSGNSWYNYNPATNVVSPIPGRVLVVRTAGGTYAKLSMLSYYRGMPENPTGDMEARYVSFDYILQPDGSRQFAR